MFSINELNYDITSAKNYIESLKLHNELKKLNNDKKEFIQFALSGDVGAGTQLDEINKKIELIQSEINKLVNIE